MRNVVYYLIRYNNNIILHYIKKEQNLYNLRNKFFDVKNYLNYPFIKQFDPLLKINKIIYFKIKLISTL